MTICAISTAPGIGGIAVIRISGEQAFTACDAIFKPFTAGVTIDVSFISLDFILPVVFNWFGGKPGEVVALVKPQFEAGREIVKHTNGVIRDSAVHAQVLEQVMTLAQKLGYGLVGLTRSPLTGSDGNTEFLLALRVGSNSDQISIPEAISQVISQENE